MEEITEVEVHRRPRGAEDDGENSGEESPPIGIGSGQMTRREESVNPLAPRPTPSPQRGSDCNIESSTDSSPLRPSASQRPGGNGSIGIGHVNPLPVDDSDSEDRPRSSAHTSANPTNQCEIEIEPIMDDEPTSSSRRGMKSASRRMCGSSDSTASDSDTADDAPLLHGSGGSGRGGGNGGVGGGGDDGGSMSQAVRIEMPPGEKPASPHDRFPKERIKAAISFLLLAFAAVLNEIVLSFVHERVPETPPLPDLTFSLIPYYQNGLKICEYIMLASFSSVLLLMLFHRHRWIMFRRLMMVGSLLYLMRCVTMISTQVPVADPNFLCSPKFGENGTFWEIVLRGLKSVAGVGLNVQGKDTLCGDYIYSGHTIVLTVSALFMGEYSPRRWRILHAFYWLVALVGVIFLVISRGHYTLDVILSYFICTRVFWSYHTMAAHPTVRLSTQNHHRKEFWFPLFRYMEGSVLKPVPRRFDCPLPMGRLRSLFRRRVANARIE